MSNAMKTLLAALAAALILSAPLAAGAQPSYAQPGPSDDAQIRGRVTNFDGAYALQVRDDKGYLDNVQLHQGTIINPTGITLAPGMVVSVLGYNAGPVFAANEIDTPYTFYGGVPYYAGHPFYYYGPTIGLSFFFGSGGWWHGPAFVGGYRYVGGIRVYNNVRVHSFYHGGTFRGPNYIAPASRGGYRGHAAASYARGGFAHGGGAHGGGGHGHR